MDIQILIGEVSLDGVLHIPDGAGHIVVFAHGSGSSRHSPRNRFVADVLNEAGLATLLFDLLTAPEESDRGNVFDIELLGHRLLGVTNWLEVNPSTSRFGVSYFGASTGAAAALWAAAGSTAVRSVVSRGGRPDLAGALLADVAAPTLLIVGSNDRQVLELNQKAHDKMTCLSEVLVIEGATHLFEEPGTLRQAAEAARDWIVRHSSAAI
ncbi:MAG: alpha/beta hydrolase [Acidimicrobiia bacterium]|nr:alpha/beta hydrolase [Acidimicrobiia bacterium]